MRTCGAKPDAKPGPGRGRDLREVAARAETEPGDRSVTARARARTRSPVWPGTACSRSAEGLDGGGVGSGSGCCKGSKHRGPWGPGPKGERERAEGRGARAWELGADSLGSEHRERAGGAEGRGSGAESWKRMHRSGNQARRTRDRAQKPSRRVFRERPAHQLRPRPLKRTWCRQR